jgi:chemotaxis protein methyltransferase CheR
VSDLPAVTEEEFRRLCEFLYRRTGMVFTEAKRYYVERRVVERIDATAAGSFGNYFARLRGDVDGEIEYFVNAFTVNETYFLSGGASFALPHRGLAGRASAAEAKGRGPSHLVGSVLHWRRAVFDRPLAPRELAAGGSIRNRDPGIGHRHRGPRTGACRRFRQARADVPAATGRRKVFRNRGPDAWKILDALRESVRFSRVNIVEAAETRAYGKFDVIFCRNVLIYFDDASRRIAAENLYENLSPAVTFAWGTPNR